MTPSLSGDPSDQTQNNNCDSTSPALTGEGAPENKLMTFVTVMAFIEMVASGLGVMLFWGATVVLLGGWMTTLQIIDTWIVFVTLVIEAIRIIRRNIKLKLHNMQNSTMWIIRFISWLSCLSYSLQLASALIISVLSAIRLHSQDFGETEEGHKMIRDSALSVFYALVLAKATVLLAEKVIWIWTVSCYKLFEKVNAECGLNEADMGSIKRFFYDAYSKCMNGSIFDGLKMDLVKFAEGLLGSISSSEQLMGARILFALSNHARLSDATLVKILTSRDSDVIERLVKILIRENSFKLEIRNLAAEIVSKLVEKEPKLLLEAGMEEAMQSVNDLLGHS